MRQAVLHLTEESLKYLIQEINFARNLVKKKANILFGWLALSKLEIVYQTIAIFEYRGKFLKYLWYMLYHD